MPHILLPEDFLPEMSYTWSWTEEGEKRVSRRKKEQKRKRKEWWGQWEREKEKEKIQKFCLWKIFKKINFIFYLAVLAFWLAGSVVAGLQVAWDPSSLIRDWTQIPCITRYIFNHWTTKEVSYLLKILTFLPKEFPASLVAKALYSQLRTRVGSLDRKLEPTCLN